SEQCSGADVSTTDREVPSPHPTHVRNNRILIEYKQSGERQQEKVAHGNMEEALCKPPVQSSCRSVRGIERQEYVRGRRDGGRGEGEREGDRRATRKKRGIRDFVCLPVRPSEPEGTSAAANLEEELGRETNTSAEKRRRERKGGIVRIVG
ncbi:Uncharacterized protein DBV15_01834, partial [Temnothorax longispinosus]